MGVVGFVSFDRFVLRTKLASCIDSSFRDVKNNSARIANEIAELIPHTVD